MLNILIGFDLILIWTDDLIQKEIKSNIMAI